MSLAFIIYLAGVITSLSKLLAIVCAVTVVCYIIYVFAYGSIHDTLVGVRVWPITLILLVGLVNSLLPSERTMWMMAGAYTGQQVMESTIGKQTIELIELKLAEELDVLKVKVKEKNK